MDTEEKQRRRQRIKLIIANIWNIIIAVLIVALAIAAFTTPHVSTTSTKVEGSNTYATT